MKLMCRKTTDASATGLAGSRSQLGPTLGQIAMCGDNYSP